MCVCVCIYQPLHTSRMSLQVHLQVLFIGLSSMFSFSTACHMKVKVYSLSSYLSVAKGRMAGVIYYSGLLALCKIRTVSFKIYDPSLSIYICVCVCDLVYIYCHPQTDLLRSVRILQCGVTHKITEAGIETRLTQTPIQDSTTRPWGN